MLWCLLLQFRLDPPLSKAAWLYLVVRYHLGRYVPRFDVIGKAEWRENQADCVARIQKQFFSVPVAVRSSKHNESDGGIGHAGRYRSLGPVNPIRRGSLISAVNAVFESYGETHHADEVLIQTWVAGAAAVLGVTSANSTSFAGTAALSYYVGDATHRANATNAITAGWTNVQRFWLTQNTKPSPHWPSAVRRGFALLATLESTLERTALELEIALDHRGRLRLLQVGPSTRVSVNTRPAALESRWRKIEIAYDQRAQPRAEELGRRTLFGLMPDWNPAELLGDHPRPLALSVFSELLTNQVWREARINLGYRRSAVHPLLGIFAGRPYVDVRASLNSLIPGGIDDVMAVSVIEASVARLKRRPELHDRIETVLQPTCIGFAEEWSQQLSDASLGAPAQRAWRQALIAMEPIWEAFSASPNARDDVGLLLRGIESRCQACVCGSDLLPILAMIRQTFALPFAMHARLAFVARFQLSSFVTTGALSPKRHDHFLSCVSAVTSIAGLNARGAGMMRPATFDICVEPIQNNATVTRPAVAALAVAPALRLAKHEKRAITAKLRSQQIETEAEAWIANALRRMELREFWKYGFSQAVSYWLSALTRWGGSRSLSTHDLSFLTVKSLASGNAIDRLKRQIASAKMRYDIDSTIKMPLLISALTDVRASTDPALRPTFQAGGHVRVSAPLRLFGRHTEAHVIAEGTVVLIDAADPGYDWIFQYSLAALVTCYGGPHSHMAVRCAELNVPCVLGCGETVFSALREATHITIDFEQQHMRVDA